ncbi:MAG: metal-dependent hydrolase [Ignisphaera sp.]
MKRSAHDVFGLAVGLWVSKAFPIADNLLINFFSIIAATMFMNRFIDGFLGHKRFRRTPYTHSFSSLLIASFAIVLLFYCFAQLLGFNMLIHPLQNLFMILLSTGLAHLLADSLTADGIYLFWPFTNRRISLTKKRYDDGLLNSLTIFISLMLTILYLYVEL